MRKHEIATRREASNPAHGVTGSGAATSGLIASRLVRSANEPNPTGRCHIRDITARDRRRHDSSTVRRDSRKSYCGTGLNTARTLVDAITATNDVSDTLSRHPKPIRQVICRPRCRVRPCLVRLYNWYCVQCASHRPSAPGQNRETLAGVFRLRSRSCR